MEAQQLEQPMKLISASLHHLFVKNGSPVPYVRIDLLGFFTPNILGRRRVVEGADTAV